MTDEEEIKKAAEIIRADVLSTRPANELAREILAPHLAKIKELEAEAAASMREIALAREQADKAEAELSILAEEIDETARELHTVVEAKFGDSCLNDALRVVNRRFYAQIQVADGQLARIETLEAEVAALRKRLVVDDAMVKRADSVFWSVGGNWIDCMRAALEAALGAVGSFPTRQELSDAAAEIEKLRAERDLARKDVDDLTTHHEKREAYHKENMRQRELMIVELVRERDATRNKALDEAADVAAHYFNAKRKLSDREHQCKAGIAALIRALKDQP